MKLKIKNIVLTLLAALCLLGFAQASFAAPPKWIATTFSGSIVVMGKDKNKPGYLGIKVVVHHKNNSKNGDIITAIYNKTLSLSAKSIYPSINSNGKFKGAVTSSRVNKCEVYPGQTYDLTYWIPLDAKVVYMAPGNSWANQNNNILYYSKGGQINNLFTNRYWSYNYSVKTSK